MKTVPASLALTALLFTSVGTCQIAEIIASVGDGAGNYFKTPNGVAVGGPDEVYVVGNKSDNALEVVGLPTLETTRLGTPPDPAAFLPGVTTGPLVGATWTRW